MARIATVHEVDLLATPGHAAYAGAILEACTKAGIQAHIEDPATFEPKIVFDEPVEIWYDADHGDYRVEALTTTH